MAVYIKSSINKIKGKYFNVVITVDSNDIEMFKFNSLSTEEEISLLKIKRIVDKGIFTGEGFQSHKDGYGLTEFRFQPADVKETVLEKLQRKIKRFFSKKFIKNN